MRHTADTGTTGPLRELRVFELATGVAGPFAGRLLAMLGATVVKAEPPGGDPARELPVDDLPFERPSPVFVHLNAGKRLVTRRGLAAALRWADVVLDDGSPALGEQPPGGPLIVTVTPGSGPTEELLVQAASGLLAVSADESGHPLRFPGWQSQYLAGAYAAALVLAGLAAHAGRAEVTWDEALLSAFESHVAADLYTLTSGRGDDPEERRRNAGRLARTYPSGVFACADGHVIPGTVRAQDWIRQCEVYGRPELPYDPRFVFARRWANRELLAEELRPWYLARSRREIFAAALRSGWAAGMVLTAGDALADPHLRERGFLGLVRCPGPPATPSQDTAPGATGARVAVRPWRGRRPNLGTETWLSTMDGDGEWFDPDRPRSAPTPRPPALAGLRVAELTLAWAGPLAGRFLAGLGADVVRVEVGDRPDGWRTRHRWRELGVPVPDGVDPDACTWDASAQFNSLNRGKRGISVDLATPEGAEVFLGLTGVADVLIVNLSSDALDRRGLTRRLLEQVDRGLVVITMPALGSTGPYRDMAGYGMLTEGMGGFAARYGHPCEHARASSTYYPDAVAGVHGTVAVLATLAGRARHGRGDWIDLSQQETLWLHLGEGLVLASREGREPARSGNTEPGATRSGILAAADGHVAFVDRHGGPPGDPGDAARRSVAEVVASLRAAGAAAEPVRSVRDRHADGTLRQWVAELDHPVVGRRGYLAVPGRLDGRRLTSPLPAPLFDQHTDQVLTEWLGLPADRIAALRAARAVGTSPRQPHRRRSGGGSAAAAG
ncbi:hypothetical protein F0L68_04450 [Solihabitans fulvus]|uniref:Crotonobetainyl-CoA:carnitine CoA-transferase CaiB n=1 Tax=Solihabitans fulvus TaxID=1892852 RepID=A0A5B2XS99_9PSEU|nr:CoA transferase [Solihabitans fulvus]KAA2265812.1 hypothetical protein F0L68_04450 [Solihabitans fulvus]